MASDPYDLICLGGAALDIVLHAPRLPKSDEKLVVRYGGRFGGGLVANAACAAARLGLRTAWSGVLGSDENAEHLIEEFETFGVHTEMARTVLGRSTDFTVIVVEPDGKRTILIAPVHSQLPPLDRELRTALASARFAYALPVEAHWFSPFAAAVHAGRGQVAVDLEASAPARGAELKQALSQSDIVFCSRDGLEHATGEADTDAAAKTLLGWGPQLVVVTLGSQGAEAFAAGQHWQASAETVRVLDTTGAGDCFHAGFLAALARSWSVPEALRFGVTAASCVVQQVGARSGLPTWNEVVELLKRDANNPSAGSGV